VQEDPGTDDLTVHIRAAARSGPESGRLTTHIADACWPGGPADRTDPVARGWLRMWGPVRIVVAVPACGCARGRCVICN